MYTVKYSQKQVEEKLDNLNNKITQHNTNINTNKENIATLNTKVEDIEKVVTELNKLPKQNTTYSFIIDQRWLNNSSDPDMLISDPFIVNKDGSRTPIRKATDPKASTYENLMLYLKKNTHAYFSTFDSSTGIMTLKQLSDTNRLKYKNGKDIDKTKDHNVFIKFPCDIYYKSEFIIPPDETEINHDYILITISIDVPLEEDLPNWEKYNQYDLIAVYHTTFKSNIPYSISNVRPIKNVSLNNIRSIYKNKGEGYTAMTYDAHKILALLFYGYYNNVKANQICGYGSFTYANNAFYPRITGLTDNLAMTDTDIITGNTVNWNANSSQIIAGKGDEIFSTNFWGIENVWGECHEWIFDSNCKTRNYLETYITEHGSITVTNRKKGDTVYTNVEDLISDYAAANHIFIVLYDINDFSIIRAIDTELQNNTEHSGCIKKIMFGKHCDIIPIEFSKWTSEMYYEDGAQIGNGEAVMCSGTGSDAYAGVAMMSTRYASNVSDDRMGDRMIFHGNENTIKIMD